MAAKRKISIRKILQVFTTFVAVTACIVAISSASRIDNDKVLLRYDIHINSDKRYHLIEERRIVKEIFEDTALLLHTPIKSLDIQSMEHILKADPLIADASLYIDAAKILHVEVIQRIPVVRLFDTLGNNYYMDNTMSIMPDSFAQYTPVVTNVPPVTNDAASLALKTQIMMLVRTIQADTFWAAQVSQIIVDSNSTFELVPVLGQQRIKFGDTSRMKEKLSNLYAFYMNVLNRIGWDKYQTLDVRFKGQVVASPSLPYKATVDRATVSMNWINSILQTEARIDSVHSVTAEKKALAIAARNEAQQNAKTNGKEKPKVELPKKDDKKVIKKDDKKIAPKDPKKDDKKKDAHPAVAAKKEVKKEPKKEDKKDVKKDAKKDDKKEVKKDPKKDAHPAPDPKKKETTEKDKSKKDDKPKAKYVLPEKKDN